MTESQKKARIFKVLSVETRVRMIEMLKDRSLCVNALARALGVSSAAVSQHLRVLRDAGAVQADKRGYFVHYRVNQETLGEWAEAARELLQAEGTPVLIPRLPSRCPEGNKGGDD